MEAHIGHNIPGLRPPPNTPSDVSCSSGPCSVVSTRETSPASSTHYPLEATSGPSDLFISCPGQHAAAAAAAELATPGRDLSRPRSDMPKPLPDIFRPRPGLNSEPPSPLEMNPNPFQPANERRSKLAVEDPRASHTSSRAIPDRSNADHRLDSTPFGQPTIPFAPLHSPSALHPSSTIARGLSTRAFRHTPPSTYPSASFTRPFCASHNFLPLAPASNSNLVCSPVANGDPINVDSLVSRHNGVETSSRDQQIAQNFDKQIPSTSQAVTMHPKTGTIIADGDMDEAMAYCYDRGNGQFTRLVPVDILPVELKDIPRRVSSDEGMIVLPVPRQPGSGGQPANIQLEHQPVSTTPPPCTPHGHAADSIQSRIDSIVNSSPGPTSGPLVLATRGFDGATPARALQLHGGASGGGSGRREKVYCDKWIHDGTCAFTQQGCKYKHEMPHDKETQEKLGLFHGYPGWWKKQALEQQRPLAIDDRPISLVTGRPSFGTLGASSSMPGALSSAVSSSNWRAGPGPVTGPVGEPRVRASPTSPSPAPGLSRGGSIGFGSGSGSRGGARQVRTFASFQPATPATYGPIGPPSRASGATHGLSRSGTSGATVSPTAAAPSTRAALTASTVASSGTDDDDDNGGGGAPYHHHRSNNNNNRIGQGPVTAYESANPFAALSAGHCDASGSNDAAADADEEHKQQRGAPL